jgi:hypothetical protein|tara:strand:+ start:176 stop:559 length:384 start_codon:yes stop_codon:yes gene_type:complete
VTQNGLKIIYYQIIVKSIKVKARKVTVEGPKGTVTKDFTHIALDIKVLNMATAKQKGKHVRIQMWNGGYKQACAVTTIKSLINNMFIGVTEVSLLEYFGHELLQKWSHAAFGVYFSFSNYFLATIFI